MKNINKKEYAKICFDSDDMQKYIEKETFEVVTLNDGYYGVTKSVIKKDFCFGYGMNGSASDEEEQIADEQEQNSKSYNYFEKVNIQRKKEKIELLQLALDNNNELFSYNYNVGVIAFCTHYCDKKLTRDYRFINSKFCDGSFDEKSIFDTWEKSTNNNYRKATVEEIKLILDAEKRQLENFKKRLEIWWKKYGADKLNTWTYLRD